MNTCLVYPPLATPFQPYSALPVLSAYLQMKGIHPVTLVDANLEFVYYILNRTYLEAVACTVESRLQELDHKTHLTVVEQKAYNTYVNCLMKAPFVCSHIETAVLNLKQLAVYRNLKDLDRDKRCVLEALELVSALNIAYPLSFYNTPESAQLSFPALAALSRDTGGNPFITFYRDKLLAQIAACAPALVGISITYQGQILPAVTLAVLLKAEGKAFKIVMGGNIISLWYEIMHPGLFAWADYFIPFEGELALYKLHCALEGKIRLAVVPNLVFLQNGAVQKNPAAVEDMDTLPAPDYRGLPLNRYLSPETVFLLSTSRGCYWSRCRFCAVSSSLKARYRVRSPGKVLQDIMTIIDLYGGKYIFFADDCIPPAALEQMAANIKSINAGIFWQCEVRFEKAFDSALLKAIREAGCLNLIFGLESCSQEVLACMDKGTEFPVVKRILKQCRENGIAFNLQFFFGFPGEKREDALKTAEFIREQAYGGATFSFGIFELLNGSQVARHPEQFALSLSSRVNNPLAVKLDYSPVPEHAAAIRDELKQALYRGTQYRFAALSLDAHTLIFLHQAGIPALSALYQKKAAPGDIDLLNSRLKSHKDKTIGTFKHLNPDSKPGNSNLVLYDYETNTMLEIPVLIGWLIKNLDGDKSISQLVNEAADDAHQAQELQSLLLMAAGELYKKGILLNNSR